MRARSTDRSRGVPRRRIAAAAALAAALGLVLAGVAISQQPVDPGFGEATGGGELVREGEALYARDCQSCHGPEGEGVVGTGPAIGTEENQGAGPPLIGVGEAAVDLYLSTGYMPLEDPTDAPEPSEPEYSEDEIEALVAFVASLGPGGEPIPEVDLSIASLPEGEKLFGEHCAGCHQIAAEGGLVLDGIAPDLISSSPTQIAEAIRVGPYLMPEFSDDQLDEQQVASVVRYVDFLRHEGNPGGWPIGRIGPIPEGLVAWIAAAIALVGVAMLIGKRAES